MFSDYLVKTSDHAVGSSSVKMCMFDVGEVDMVYIIERSIVNAAGIDGISLEHILYVHPCVIIRL